MLPQSSLQGPTRDSFADASDEDLVAAITSGNKSLYVILMRRYNQRVYRLVRAIIRDDDEAEDIVQHAYVVAYTKLTSFRGESSFATWLTRIAINEALARARKSARRPHVTLVEPEATESTLAHTPLTPEDQTYRRQVGVLLERYIDQLPDNLRVVFMMREVEELSTLETAQLLSLSAEAVRVRLYRARQMLQENLSSAASFAPKAFHFAGERCNRIVDGVLARLGLVEPPSA